MRLDKLKILITDNGDFKLWSDGTLGSTVEYHDYIVDNDLDKDKTRELYLAMKKFYGDYTMNDLLLKLLNIKNKIKHNGWITIVPNANSDLVLRVKWYLEQKYEYEQRFTIMELKDSNVDLAEYFVETANREIERLLGESS